MSNTFDSRLGEQLYRLLPEVYRTRDKKMEQAGGDSETGDLAKYLDAHGHLLDLIHETLKQQLDDTLPESSQDWLLPYFAQLLAANIVSPDSKGRHAEITHAVSWRQRKGTLKCAEEIAEAVGQMEVELQEGWKRVAMTPRIGMPLIPAKVWDAKLNLDMTIPSEAMRHPTLPAVMVDLRRPSRAVEALSTNPAARVSSFGGVKQTWRQMNRHGVPCFPGSFDDVSRRTVDFRTPDTAKGRVHHKRLLAYAPPPTGLFPLDSIQLKWSERNNSPYDHLIEETEENGVTIIRNQTDRIIEITDDAVLSASPYRVEGLDFKTTLSVANGGCLELHRVEADKVQVDTSSTDKPVLIAKDCLLNTLSVGNGIADLDSCSVLDTAYLYDLLAINCIFTNISDPAITGTVKSSRIPPAFLTHITAEDCTTQTPSLFSAIISYDMGTGRRVNDGPGVLRPDCDASIYEGASDGGEMGYFHRGRENRPVRIDTAIPDLSASADYALKDLLFGGDIKVTSGHLELDRVAVSSLTIETALAADTNGVVVPALEATACLFETLNVTHGLARLEFCTVMDNANCKHLQASDCIFADTLSGVTKQSTSSGATAFLNCLRYSSIPSKFLEGIKAKPDNAADKKLARALQLIDGEGNLTLRTNTLQGPVFGEFLYCSDPGCSDPIEPRKAGYGEWGYGVLDPVTADAIRFGAEDGGEMGAYHDEYYSLKAEAVLDKMREFLPVGIEPVLIQDTRLLRVPPEQIISEA